MNKNYDLYIYNCYKTEVKINQLSYKQRIESCIIEVREKNIYPINFRLLHHQFLNTKENIFINKFHSKLVFIRNKQQQ